MMCKIFSLFISIIIHTVICSILFVILTPVLIFIGLALIYHYINDNIIKWFDYVSNKYLLMNQKFVNFVKRS